MTPPPTEILDLEGGLEDIDLNRQTSAVVLLTENR